ncbi:MAG: histidine ammonia-lyase [Fimbriimonadales bacterium]
MKSVVLTGGPLSIKDVARVAGGVTVAISDKAKAKARGSRKILETLERDGDPIYGVNTGFGALKSERIPQEDAIRLQVNLIRSHAVGVGDPLAQEETRAAMLLLAASHLRGASGVGPETAELLCDLLNRNILPFIPCQGSLGASGDLAPLAHLGMALIGDEHPVYTDMDNDQVCASLLEAGVEPLKLGSKGGLSIINGTHVHTAIAALLMAEAKILAKAADIACSMNLEAMLGSAQPFRADVHALRPHPHQADSASNITRLIQNSELIESHQACHEVQDAYSIRCAPQVHGASRQAIAHARDVVEIELRSVTDNPLVVGHEVISAGHFHGEPVGLALDYFKIGVSELAAISERRTERALNKDYSRGLPAFLTPDPGLNSGLMICQYTAAALVSENKVLCHPSCVDSITTGANQEDHVSMAMNAALHARKVIENTGNVLAVELIVGAQALDCRRAIQKHEPGAGTLAACRAVRKQVLPIHDDRSLSREIQSLDLATIVAEVELAVGGLD